MHQREQLVAPDRHAAIGADHDGFAAGEIRRVHRIEIDAALVAAAHQRKRYVGRFHEAEADHNAVEMIADGFDLQPLVLRRMRHVERIDGEKHVAFVQHFVVFEVVHQRVRNHGLVGSHEHRGARHPYRRGQHQAGQEAVELDAFLADFGVQQLAASTPGAHHRECADADEQRHPGADAGEQLGTVGDQERQIDHQKHSAQRQYPLAGVGPTRIRDDRQQQRIDQHGAGHRQAIGRGQRGRTAEREHQHDHCGEQHPVDRRHVDLADGVLGGVFDRQSRQVAQLDRLTGHRKRASDHRLRSDRCGHRRQHQHRDLRPLRDRHIERIGDGFGIRQQHRALPVIVQYQRRQNKAEPTPADRFFSKVAHVGIQRFTAGDGQHHRAENQHRMPVVGGEKIPCPVGIHGLEYARILGDVVDTERCDHHEPGDHDRAEGFADFRGAETLDCEQPAQNHQTDRHHPLFEHRRDHFQTLDRAKHGDGRGDHAVAEKQRRAENAENAHDVTHPRAGLEAALRKRGERHDAALAFVVGAHDHDHVLQRDHQQQRPETQRQQALDRCGVGHQTEVRMEHFLDGVQRAGADIAEHHADRTGDQRDHAGRCVAAGVRGRVLGTGSAHRRECL